MFYATEEPEIKISDSPQPGFVQVMEPEDIVKNLDSIKRAEQWWNQLTADYVKQHGDGGTCVMGAGIEILYIPRKTPKLRGLKRLKIISQPGCCQGSINWEGERLQMVLDMLKKNGIQNPRYNPGWMD